MSRLFAQHHPALHRSWLPPFAAHTSFPGDKPSVLVRLQKEHWDPLVAWLKDTYGVTVGQTTGFGLPEHSPNAREELRAVLSEMDKWELAAFERAVYATKSFVTALAFVKGRITAHEAAQAAHVEVRSQIEKWGEVEDCEYTEGSRRGGANEKPTTSTTRTSGARWEQSRCSLRVFRGLCIYLGYSWRSGAAGRAWLIRQAGWSQQQCGDG